MGLSTLVDQASPRLPTFRSAIFFSGLKCWDSKFPPYTSQLSWRPDADSTRAWVTLPRVTLPPAWAGDAVAVPGLDEAEVCVTIATQASKPVATIPARQTLIAPSPQTAPIECRCLFNEARSKILGCRRPAKSDYSIYRHAGYRGLATLNFVHWQMPLAADGG